MRNLLYLFSFILLTSCALGLAPSEYNAPEYDDIMDAVAATAVEVDNEPTLPEATEIWEPRPPKVKTSPGKAPSDAIVLFDGSNLDAWRRVQDSTAAKWQINKDRSMTVVSGSGTIETKQNFGSMQLHVEWKSPTKIVGIGQSRANSGVFIQQRYEVQIVDNNDNDTYVNGQVGSIYKQSIPAVNPAVPTGQWNSYDIIFHAPEYEGNYKVKAGTITVLFNGVLVQDHFEIEGAVAFIGWPKDEPHGDAPLQLQDHNDGSRPSFRNIWVRPLD